MNFSSVNQTFNFFSQPRLCCNYCFSIYCVQFCGHSFFALKRTNSTLIKVKNNNIQPKTSNLVPKMDANVANGGLVDPTNRVTSAGIPPQPIISIQPNTHPSNSNIANLPNTNYQVFLQKKNRF